LSIRIGTISVSLTAETASFSTEMSRASQMALTSSKQIERSFNIMGAAIVAATGAAVGALGLLLSKTQDVVFQMQKQAQQAGVSVEAYSKLAYAAKEAGMDQQQMAVIMTRVSKSSFEAASGNKKSAAAYKALGITVMDANGHFKTADQLILEVAKSLDQFKDSAGKTGIESTIMGRSGPMAANFLEILSTRFDEVSATAEKLGLVISGEVAAGALKLHQHLVLLEGAALGLSVRLLSKLSPALDELAEKIVAFVAVPANLDKVSRIGEELADGLHVAGEALDFVIKHFDGLKTLVEGLIAIRLGGMFIPMIASAAGAEGTIGKLGIALGNMGGTLLGIKGMGKMFAPLAQGAAGYAGAVRGLAVEEGMAATGALVMSDALAMARTAMVAFVETVPLAAAIAASFYLLATGIENIRDDFDLANKAGKSFWDVQIAKSDEAYSSLSNYIGVLKAAFGFKDETYNADMNRRLGIKDARNPGAPKAPGRPEGYDTDPAMGGKKKKDMGPLDKGEDKFAALTKRLAELKERAEQAKRALNLVGASPQEQRDSKILEEYNLFLAEEKKLLDQLSPAKRAAAEASAHDSIANKINAEAAEKYEKALFDLSLTLSTSVQEHESMAAAVGKSAQAMQDAMVKAKVAQEMQKAYGNGWEKDPTKVLDAEMTGSQIRDEMNKANAVDDAKALDNAQLQAAAQDRVNAAILRGADAQRDAAVANEKAALTAEFHTRGDTDTDALQKQLDLIDKRDEAERRAGDLQKASSMDPALKYKEQTKAIMDAVAAAETMKVALDIHEVMAANRQAWLDYKSAQDKAMLGSDSMVDGLKVAFDQMARDTESAAQQMHDAVMQAVGSLNDAITKAMMATGPGKGRQIKQDFGEAFKNIGGSLAKKGVEKAESAVLKNFGFGKKDGSSEGSALWVQIANGAKKVAGTKTAGVVGNAFSKLFGHKSGDVANAQGTPGLNELSSLLSSVSQSSPTTTSSVSPSGGAGNAVSSIVGSLLKFIPFFADGTDSMVPDMPAIVGEKGPELFIPPSAGAIVPNSKLKNFGSGGDTHYNIDARGATDPAQTAAMVRQGIMEAAPHIAAAALKAGRESNVRTPPSARR
jgi:hypothetical protein